jgi:hypothetical protein
MRMIGYNKNKKDRTLYDVPTEILWTIVSGKNKNLADMAINELYLRKLLEKK